MYLLTEYYMLGPAQGDKDIMINKINNICPQIAVG